MAIDFSQVKNLTIPEGTVTKIENAQGVVLWTKPIEQGWHTLWSGSKNVGVSSGTDQGDTTNWLYTQSNTGYTPRIKLTFSITTSSGTNSYELNGQSVSSAPTSPQDLTINVGTSYLNILKAQSSAATNKYGYGRVYANRDTSNNRVSISLDSYKTTTNNFTGTARITLTKVEQYY